MNVLLLLSLAFPLAVMVSYRAGRRSQRKAIQAAFELGRKSALTNKGDLIRKAYRLGVAKGRHESGTIPSESEECV